MSAPVVTIIVTHVNHSDYRFRASKRVGTLGRQVSAQFNWPADLNLWVKHARKTAERQGLKVQVHDDTGEVR